MYESKTFQTSEFLKSKRKSSTNQIYPNGNTSGIFSYKNNQKSLVSSKREENKFKVPKFQVISEIMNITESCASFKELDKLKKEFTFTKSEKNIYPKRSSKEIKKTDILNKNINKISLKTHSLLIPDPTTSILSLKIPKTNNRVRNKDFSELVDQYGQKSKNNLHVSQSTKNVRINSKRRFSVKDNIVISNFAKNSDLRKSLPILCEVPDEWTSMSKTSGLSPGTLKKERYYLEEIQYVEIKDILDSMPAK